MIETRKKIGKKGQVHLPKQFIDQFGIRPGDEVRVEVHSDGILIKPLISPSDIRKLLSIYHSELDKLGVIRSHLGELKGVTLEEEFE